ncbi:hypothetical protein ACFYPN_20485 [Streptomyces sp. NPDC005576]|uniref:hypothetical protein n=1 Tax=unclassified Streptomyces TaxID=2593676 RepID=UPI0033CD483E
MTWQTWIAVAVGVVSLAAAGSGWVNRPGGSGHAVRRHRLYRVVLPLFAAWFCLVGRLPQAFHASWLVSDVCRLVAVAPVFLVFLAARSRAR